MKKSILLFTAILTAFLFALPVYAADIRLSSLCTLADAIIAANNDQVEGDCPAGRGADTITLSQDITLQAELPVITSAITIEGNGYTISGDSRYRIFYNDGGALIIKDLTMTKGRVEGEFITNADGTVKASTANPIGGAIVNGGNGELSISDSTFSDNSAEAGGAIYNWEGTLSISNSSFSGNSAASGGAIYNWEGTLSISSSTFSNNSAEYSGAIFNGEDKELSISDSLAEYLGGAISNEEDEELSISDSSFSNNSAKWGGAIGNDGELSIVNSAFSHNSALLDGGAISNAGELSISSSTFSNNSADRSVGAISNAGELSIVSSTFSGNSAKEYSGAINNLGEGELRIINSTFSGNSAKEHGGAINNWGRGELSISDSTFSGNSADKGGAISNLGEGELSISDSIIAGDGGNACFSDGGLKQNIGNFIQDDSCSPAFSGDPKLGELVEPEDGSPAYFPLLAGSPAIDAAGDGYCPETDQIGTVRPQGTGCDIGAIEYVAP